MGYYRRRKDARIGPLVLNETFCTIEFGIILVVAMNGKKLGTIFEQ